MSRAAKFKSRAEYAHWVARNCVEPFTQWKRAFGKLPRLAPFWRPTKVVGTSLLPTLGHAVAGTIALKASRLAGPAVWLVASRAEGRALSVLVKRPVTCVVPYVLPEAKLRLARSWARRADRSRQLTRLGLDPSLFTFFFAGRISERKGLAALVQEAERQKFACQLIVAGYREPAFKLPPSRYVKIKALGRLPRDQVLKLMALADAVPSLSTDGSEDFGLLAREALALGVPVLITRWGGLADIKLEPAVDKKMIRRFKVKAGSGLLPLLTLQGLNLKDYALHCRALSAAVRDAAAKQAVQANKRGVRLGLERAFKLARESGGRAVEYLPLARELALAAAASGEVDPNTSFPQALQRKLLIITD